VTAAAGDPGEEHGRRADLAAFAESQWPEREREGIGPDEDTIVSAAAVGLVELVWRNSPLEDMHAGGGPARARSERHEAPDGAGQLADVLLPFRPADDLGGRRRSTAR
jgi:hypothetical protein